MSQDSYTILKEKIDKKKAKICVVGLGYVGLPLAVALGRAGYFVYGFEKVPAKIRRLQRGVKYIVDVEPSQTTSLINKKRFEPTSDERVLASSDVIIICVPTPLRKVKIPDISYVVAASKTIAKYLTRQQLVILESTSYPTTTREVILPILQRSGLKQGRDFFLCFSPERVNPGDKKFPLTKIPKVVGGLSAQAGRLAKALYGKIIKKVHVVSSPEAAETAKLLENTFRLVNIGLINEFAIFCHKLGINIWEVIEAAKTKPFGFMPFYPGPGVGGHCIPCDPVYLSWKAQKLGFKTEMIDLAAYINHFMPKYVIKRTQELLRERKTALRGARIMIVGVAYKKDVKDLRESSALDIIKGLMKKGARVHYFDPFFPYLDVPGIKLKRAGCSAANLKSYDCLILTTAHSGVDYEFIRKNSRLIFDTRNIYGRDFANVKGI